MSNTFGNVFRWTTFGESHGPAMGVVLEGCPAGVEWNLDSLQSDLARRKPGQVDPVSKKVLVTDRNEADEVQVLSGIFEGKTLGTPIACMVMNRDQRSQDYEKVKSQARIGHADDVWHDKFEHSDYRGGGRASARETVSRVIAGNFAKQFLKQKFPQLRVTGFVRSIHTHELDQKEELQIQTLLNEDQFSADQFVARFPQSKVNIDELLIEAKKNGESYGGVVEVWVDQVPRGLGEPVFGKIKNQLASAMMSIGATSGFELGNGFSLTQQKGTDVHISELSSVYGGVRGGITTGERIIFRVAFKPTSSIKDTAQSGRHDPCIVPRAVPVVEAMTWAVLADMELLSRLNKI